MNVAPNPTASLKLSPESSQVPETQVVQESMVCLQHHHHVLIKTPIATPSNQDSAQISSTDHSLRRIAGNSATFAIPLSLVLMMFASTKVWLTNKMKPGTTDVTKSASATTPHLASPVVMTDVQITSISLPDALQYQSKVSVARPSSVAHQEPSPAHS